MSTSVGWLSKVLLAHIINIWKIFLKWLEENSSSIPELGDIKFMLPLLVELLMYYNLYIILLVGARWEIVEPPRD